MKTQGNHTGNCQVCGHEKKILDLIPISSINNTLIEIIKKKNPDIDAAGLICLNDLNNLRNLYVQEILADENGQISSLAEEVVNSMSADELISKNTNEDIDFNITFGERVSDKIAKFGGSWPFIFIFGAFLVIWMAINIFILNLIA